MMEFRIGDRDEVERGIRLLFNLLSVTVGTLVLMFILNETFGMKPSLLSVVISGAIAGGLGHAAGSGVIALLGLIWPRDGKHRAAASKKGSTPVKRRKRRPIEDE